MCEFQLPLIKTYTPTLEALYSMVYKCDGCSYHMVNDNRVNGSGPVNARIMIIGQGPGPSEIKAGKPYVGGSGKLLKRVLKKVGFDLKEVYFTNLIRCMQPGNTIMVDPIRKCRRWLDDEVAHVSPRLIVCLGALAALHVADIKSADFAATRGAVIPSVYDISTICTYHTAYLLRIKNDKELYAEKAKEEYAIWKRIYELSGGGDGGS